MVGFEEATVPSKLYQSPFIKVFMEVFSIICLASLEYNKVYFVFVSS